MTDEFSDQVQTFIHKVGQVYQEVGYLHGIAEAKLVLLGVLLKLPEVGSEFRMRIFNEFTQSLPLSFNEYLASVAREEQEEEEK